MERSSTPNTQTETQPNLTRTRTQTRANASQTSSTTTERRVEETEEQRIERLGRERPPQFKTTFAEIGFCYSVIASQFMAEYFVSGFNVLLPTLMKKLDIPAAAAVWPSASFALVTSAFLLPCGRLADMLGGYPIFLGGLLWFTLWSVITGFSQNQLMLDWCRAMQGLGPAAFLPSGVMILGSNYRPGPRKNLVFSIYGGSAALGFFFGVFIAGLAGSFLSFGWYFWIGAMLVFTTAITTIWSVPNERRAGRTEMDWLGSVLIVSGLVLTIFALTDGSHAPRKWTTAYIPATLEGGLVLLAAAFYVEGWIAKEPLIPFHVFKTPYLKPLFVGCLFNYGCLGIFLLYSTLYMHNVMGATAVQIAAWYTPMCLGGVLISVAGGYVLHLIPGTILILISSVGWVVAALMFAITPPHGNYWAYVFPAMCGATVGVDVTFNVTNVFISTNMSVRNQGLAGGLLNSLLYLGIAIFLALADVTQTETAHQGLAKSYRNVFWFMLACAGASFVIMQGFVRIPRAKSEMTVDERRASEGVELLERLHN